MENNGMKGGKSLPEKIELAPEKLIWRGTLVKLALAESGLNFEAWQKLKDAERDESVSKTLEGLKALVAEGKDLPQGVSLIPAGAPAESPKAKRGEQIDVTHHLHPDYSGPLTGDQAMARHAQGLVDARIKSEGQKGKK